MEDYNMKKVFGKLVFRCTPFNWCSGVHLSIGVQVYTFQLESVLSWTNEIYIHKRSVSE
jgi:hypothetical protein